MKIIFFLCFFLGFGYVQVSGQSFKPAKIAKLDSMYEPKLAGETFIERTDLIGQPFFNEEWTNSDIRLCNGQMVFNKLLKLNGFEDEIIWQKPGKSKQIKLDKLSVNEFWLKNYRGKSYHFIRINTKQLYISDSTDIFAQVAIEGKLSVFVYRKISITGTKNVVIKGKFYYHAEISPTPIYYLKALNGPYMGLLKIKRNSFLNLFGEKKKDIRKLLRQHHQSIKNEDDLIRAIKLLNNEQW